LHKRIKTVGIVNFGKLELCPKLIVRIDVGQGMENRERSGATGSALNATNKQNRRVTTVECALQLDPVAPLRFAPGSALVWV